MNAEIIAVGTELTSGEKLDTNSQWLSLQLADLGVPVLYHTTVADDLQRNIDVMRLAVDRADLVLITGGLGPTLDDLTRDALAGVLGVGLEVHQESLEKIEAMFRGRGREMPARNRVQALFPVGAEVLPNAVGTAPGIWLTAPRAGRAPCLVAAMPGVPSEMYRMFQNHVVPRLQCGASVIRRARINCFGLGESATEELLGELTARGRDPEIGITAHEATITLRIISRGTSIEECQQKLTVATQEIRMRLQGYVFGIEDEELEDVVIRQAIAGGRRLATIEGATKGALAQRLGGAIGAEDCYVGGFVSPRLKDDLEASARRLANEMQADMILAVGEQQDRAGENIVSGVSIPILLLAQDEVSRMEFTWNGNPAITRSFAVKHALNMARKELEKEQSK